MCFYYVLYILHDFDISLGYFKQNSCFYGFFLSCFPLTCLHFCFHIRCWPNTRNPKTKEIYSLSSLLILFVCVCVCLYLCVCVLPTPSLSQEILRIFSPLLQIRTHHYLLPLEYRYQVFRLQNHKVHFLGFSQVRKRNKRPIWWQVLTRIDFRLANNA